MEKKEGILDITKFGYGFVLNEKGKDYYVAKENCKKFINGDKVSFIVENFKNKEEAKDLELIERKDIISIVLKENEKIYTKINNKKVYFTNKEKDYLNSYVKIRYDLETEKYYITEKIGDLSQEKIENQIVIEDYEIPYQFSDKIKKELNDIQFKEEDFKGRIDYRDLPFITIDGEYSKDFDDAVYCEKNENGYSLYVAIADVAHYVVKESELDKEALNRGNSVYFSNEVIPMLPELLSNELCSLNPEEDKLVLVCKMNFNKKGGLTSYKFSEGIIKSHKRFTYNEVYKIIIGEANTDSILLDNIKNLKSIYEILIKKREERGALNFETKEGRVIFDDNFKIEKVVIEERNEAHKIIEECMLIANVCAAKVLNKHEVLTLYRNHPVPNEDKIVELRKTLNNFGVDLRKAGKDISTIHFKILLDKIEKTPYKDLLEKNVLRAMSKAVYEIDNRGHFGLGYDKYTHFTSPIRRYTDLIVHRNLKNLIHNEKDYKEIIKNKTIKKEENLYGIEELSVISEHINMTERRANSATQEAYEMLTCYYLKDKEEELNNIPAKIVHFNNNFMYVEMVDYLIEGIIYYKDLKGYFNYIKEKEMIVSNKNKYSLGDLIQVKIKEIDYENKKAILKIS